MILLTRSLIVYKETVPIKRLVNSNKHTIPFRRSIALISTNSFKGFNESLTFPLSSTLLTGNPPLSHVPSGRAAVMSQLAPPRATCDPQHPAPVTPSTAFSDERTALPAAAPSLNSQRRKASQTPRQPGQSSGGCRGVQRFPDNQHKDLPPVRRTTQL